MEERIAPASAAQLSAILLGVVVEAQAKALSAKIQRCEKCAHGEADRAVDRDGSEDRHAAAPETAA